MGHVPLGDAIELLMDERNQPLVRTRVSLPPLEQQAGDLRRRGTHAVILVSRWVHACFRRLFSLLR